MTDKKLTAYDVFDHYDEAYFADLAGRYRRRNRFARRRIANVFSLLPELKGKRFLDLGCGMGTFTLEAAKQGAFAVGVDLAPAGVAAARLTAKQEQVESASFILGDAARLPLHDASVDIVLAADFTEHLDDDTFMRVLAQVAHVLKSGGLLECGILLEQEPSHIGIRSAEELAFAAEQAGFTVQGVRYLASHLPVWNLLERAFGRWVPLLRRRIGLTARRP